MNKDDKNKANNNIKENGKTDKSNLIIKDKNKQNINADKSKKVDNGVKNAAIYNKDSNKKSNNQKSAGGGLLLNQKKNNNTNNSNLKKKNDENIKINFSNQKDISENRSLKKK